ncbi:MAG: hypothetical protein E3K29_03930 [Candidatus Brocadia sp.]|nr:hypothetical protein [Candidatus Brocadia sp.]
MYKKTWEPPKTLKDVPDTMDRLSALIQFVQDLTAQPTEPIAEYNFSSHGYSGFYLFLGIVQDTIEECNKTISDSSKHKSDTPMTEKGNEGG